MARIGIFAATALIVCATIAWSHPGHPASYSEAEWNPKTRSLEVAMRIAPEDLEQCLSKQLKKKIVLENLEKLDELLTVYVAEKFKLIGKDKKPIKSKWIGKELKIRTTWIYFEFPLGKDIDIDDCLLSNLCFMEEFPEQKNTVVLRKDRKRRALVFSEKVKILPIREIEKKKVRD